MFVPPIEYGVPEYQEPMPFTCQPPRILPSADLRVLQEGQLVEEAQLGDVRPVEAREGEVVVVLQRVVPGEPDPAVLVRHVLRLG